MGEHSPTPWKIVEETGKDQSLPFLLTTTCEDEWNVVAIFGDVPHLPAEANAAFVVHAVNLHDEMVEALKEAIEYVDYSHVRERLRSALARATQTNTGE